jgi:hypothetical protein
VIESLRRKPRAFLSCIWQQDLLPDDHYRQLWQQIHAQFDSYTAARLITEALYIAASQDKEQAVATYLAAQLEAGTLSLLGLQQHFQRVTPPPLPPLQVQQHPIQDYDQLLSPSAPNPPDRVCQPVAEVPSLAPHAPSLAGVRTSGTPAAVDLCSVLTCRL